MSFYREQLEAWLKTQEVKAQKVLDIGGSANPLPGRTKTWIVDKYYIFDNNNEQSYHDKFKTPDIKGNICLHQGTWEWPKSIPYEFDAVFMLEVAEYLIDPMAALQHCYALTKKNGLFFSSWPALYPIHQPIQSDYLRYSKQWIKDAMTLIGFEDIQIIPRTMTEGRSGYNEFFLREGMRAAKHTPEIYDIGYMVRASK